MLQLPAVALWGGDPSTQHTPMSPGGCINSWVSPEPGEPSLTDPSLPAASRPCQAQPTAEEQQSTSLRNHINILNDSSQLSAIQQPQQHFQRQVSSLGICKYQRGVGSRSGNRRHRVTPGLVQTKITPVLQPHAGAAQHNVSIRNKTHPPSPSGAALLQP